MRTFVGILILGLSCYTAAKALRAAADPPPPWAYGFAAPPPPSGTSPTVPSQPAANPRPAAADPAMYQVPGSDVTMTRAQVGDRYNIGDWFPNDHQKMPYIVQYGRRPDVWACGFCHLVNGKGRPENSSVSGLPVSYFIQQLNDFKNDLRKSADPRKANTNLMIAMAKSLSDAEMRASAEYFAQIPWDASWIEVVESATVPKTRNAAGMWLSLDNGEHEPLGDRIMEMPVHNDWAELRDYRQEGSFVAYAPIGSVKKGEALATSGSKVARCSICHGDDLRGLGPVPGIAGRSPSYTARQLYDMQQGTRNGPWASLMKPVVDRLTADDLLNVSAYVASLPVGSVKDKQSAAR